MLICALITGSLLLAPAAGAPAKQKKLAVLEVDTKNVDAETGAVFTEVLTAEIHAQSGAKVISSSDIKAMLGLEEQRQNFGCDDVSCMSELGGALGVDLLVASQVGLVGDTYVVSISLIDVKKAETLGRAYEKVTGEVDQVLETIKTSVRQLMNKGHARAGAAGASGQPLLGIGAVPVSLGAVGLIGLGTASVFGFKARSRANTANDPSADDRQAAIDEGESAQTLANVMFALGGVAIGAAAAVYWLSADDSSGAVAVMPWVSDTTLGMAIAWTP